MGLQTFIILLDAHILPSQLSDSFLANWHFYCTSQELSVIIINLALKFFNFHAGLHCEFKGLKKLLGEQLVSLLLIFSFIFFHFLDCLLNIFAQMAFVIILSSFYVFLCTEDLLRMLETPISNASSIWEVFVSSNLAGILLFLVIAHSASQTWMSAPGWSLK